MIRRGCRSLCPTDISGAGFIVQAHVACRLHVPGCVGPAQVVAWMVEWCRCGLRHGIMCWVRFAGVGDFDYICGNMFHRDFKVPLF